MSPMFEVWSRGDKASIESILPAADAVGTVAMVVLSAADTAGTWMVNEAINANINAKILFIGCKITQKSSNKQKITQLFFFI